MQTEWKKVMLEGELTLPVCLACRTVQYPLREVCVHCLTDELEWRQVNNTGLVLAVTVQRYTLDEKFNALLPLCVASVKLDVGPVVIVFADVSLKAGQKALVVNRKTDQKEVTLFATARDSGDR